MSLMNCLSAAAFWRPEHVSHPLSWVGHIPFAFWLVEAAEPEVLVELGTHSGNSYFAFCQAVKGLQLKTRCHAVDTWEGDEHSGFYGEDVFQAVSQKNRREFDSFSRLIRSPFDAAIDQFSDTSIDLLHIDGLHTYEAVKHDLHNWLPKMSRRGVIIMHDTNVHTKDFGVFAVFQEAAAHFPAFEFTHSHGLGVLGVGSELPQAVRPLFEAYRQEAARNQIRACYGRLGQAVLDEAIRTNSDISLMSVSSELALAHESLAAGQRHIDTLEADARRAVSEIVDLRRGNDGLQEQLAEIQQSLGWTLLNRARIAHGRLIREDARAGRFWSAMTRHFKSAEAAQLGPR